VIDPCLGEPIAALRQIVEARLDRPARPLPGNSMRGIGPSACSRTEGKRRRSLFSASSRLFGTVWAWVSMIMRFFSFPSAPRA
jgi:hypothetical protein